MERKIKSTHLITFIILAIAIAISALLYQSSQKQQLRNIKLREVAAIADLKVSNISAWREERQKDVRQAVQRYNARAVRDFFSGSGKADLRSDLERHLQNFGKFNGYRKVLLLDPVGKVRLSFPSGSSVDSETLKEMLAAPPSFEPRLTDLHRTGAGNETAVDVFIRIPDPDRPEHPPIGFFLAEIDPTIFLYPYIQRWPVPSRTAETLLVERQGNEVVFLNELRHLPGTQLSMRRPLTERDLPAARAALQQNGVMEGKDYSGEPVVAAYRSIPGSPWGVVSKVDESELYGSLQTSSLLVGGIALSLIVMAGAVSMYLIRVQKVRILEERDRAREDLLESERRSAATLRAAKDQLEQFTTLLDYAPVLARNIHGEVTIWNTGMENMYGFSVAEAVGKVSHTLLQTVFPQPLEEINKTLLSEGKWQGELRHVTRDGRQITVASLWVLHQSAAGNDVVIEVNNDITTLNEAEAAIRAGEERIAFAVEAAKLGSWNWDLKSGALTWNDRCKGFYGYPPDYQMTYDAFLQAIHEEDREGTDAALRTAIKDKTEYVSQKRVVLPGGEVRWILDKGRALYDDQGEPLSMSGISMDVTEQKETETALLHLSALVESSTEAIISITKDLDGTIQTWNRGAQRVYGYTPEEAIGRNISFLVPPGYPDDTVAILDTIRRGGSVEGLETVRMKKDGRILHMSVNVSPIKDAKGIVIGASKIGIDITARKKAEEELQKSEERFRTLAEALPQLVWIASEDGAVEYLNSRWYQYTGSNGTESLGEGWTKFLHPEDSPQVAEIWTHSVETGEPYQAQYRLKGADNVYHWFVGRGLPVREKGRVKQWFGTCTDIEELRQARETAEAAARSKTDFLANMSHEVRTPMNGIMGVTDLLQGTELTALQRQYLDMIKSSAEGLLSVINDVLDFSKLEAGAVVLDNVEFDLQDTVERSVDNLSIRAFQKGLELVVAVAPELPAFFLGDPAKLRQVLLNIVANAVKFTEKGEVVVRVDGTQTVADKYKIRFSVADTGVGIPQDKLTFIFQSFTQADTSVSRSYGGTGLGLAISKRIVEQMGGQISVESEEGVGSTFSFEIELQKAEPIHPEGLPQIEEFPGLRVLVLDDNEANRFFLRNALHTMGVVVEEASLGQEAIDKVLEASVGDHSFDLVFLDQHLPDMDGFQVAQLIAERSRVKNTCIVMITSDDISGGARRARELGMAAYIVKPVRLANLRQVLSSLCGRPAETMMVVRDEGAEPALSAAAPPEVPLCASVLIAEDNPVNLTVAETALRNAGFRVTSAANGKEAVDAFEHGRFHLILMDVQMPEMDGFEATRVLRAKGADTPIVGLTAHAMKGDRERCLGAGMNDYISKPFTATALVEKVSHWVREHPLPATEPETILQQVGGNPEFFDLLVETSLKSAPSQLADIKAAMERNDSEQLQRAAHRMKGSVAVVAAEVAKCLAEELEKLAKDGDLAKVDQIFAKLEAEMAKVIEQLRKLRPENDRGVS